MGVSVFVLYIAVCHKSRNGCKVPGLGSRRKGAPLYLPDCSASWTVCEGTPLDRQTVVG